MGIRILTNADDDMAMMYQSCADWAFGPVIYSNGRMSAEALAEKFIEWAALRSRGPFEDWSDSWLEGKWVEFMAMDWIECPECYGEEMVPQKQGVCQKCLETCTECGDTGVDTKPKSRPGKKAERLCSECIKQLEVL